jgi:hypothetical protein
MPVPNGHTNFWNMLAGAGLGEFGIDLALARG